MGLKIEPIFSVELSFVNKTRVYSKVIQIFIVIVKTKKFTPTCIVFFYGNVRLLDNIIYNFNPDKYNLYRYSL